MTAAEVWAAWCAYCREPKTIFDFKDRVKALFLLGIFAVIMYLLVEVLLN